MIGIEAGRFVSVWTTTDRAVYDERLGFYVTPAYADDLTAIRRLAAAWDTQGIPEDRRLLSVYTSPLDIAAGAASPADVGSLIHALGQQKRAAFTALVANSQVTAVTTIAPDYSGWEGWIRRAHAPFIRALHQHYRPIARNDQQVLWIRTPGRPWQTTSATCRVTALSQGTLAIDITAPVGGVAYLAIIRQPPFATGRGAMLTVTEASPDTATPQADRWTDFPRYGVANSVRLELLAPVAPERATRLTLDSLDGSSIGKATCTAEVSPPFDLAALPSLPDGIARYLAQGAR
jgi:hypothetical protein